MTTHGPDFSTHEGGSFASKEDGGEAKILQYGGPWCRESSMLWRIWILNYSTTHRHQTWLVNPEVN
jgi:hypothetical protein